MTQRLRQLPGAQIAIYLFGQDALAASQTDVQLPTVMGEASQAVAGYTIPYAFEVLAVVADTSVAGSAGTLTVGATLDGTEDTDTTLSITTETTKTKAVTRNTCVGTAGQILGCEITTDGTWNGTTADLMVQVYVALYPSGI
jgi:hypothetical protein